MSQIRLQKFLADCGIASRRKCEEFILQGYVKVNGDIITTMGKKVDITRDVIEFKGKKVIQTKEEKIYILLNKPIGYVTTVKDQFDRPTILDLIPIDNIRLYPVGRLDMYTSGALIISNDGDFVYKVTHPKHNIDKTYMATIKGEISAAEIEALEKGMKIDDYITSPAKVRILNKETNSTIIEMTIHEGKNRQVRKMFEHIGKKVIALHRTKISNVEINNLESGQWRYLKKNEVEKIKSNL